MRLFLAVLMLMTVVTGYSQQQLTDTPRLVISQNSNSLQRGEELVVTIQAVGDSKKIKRVDVVGSYMSFDVNGVITYRRKASQVGTYAFPIYLYVTDSVQGEIRIDYTVHYKVISSPHLSMKEAEFQLAVGFVAAFLERKDSVKLSRYIDKSRGVYILYTIGVNEAFQHFKTIGFSDTGYPNYPFYEGIIVSPPKYASLPTYDCEKWSKSGTYVDTTRTDHLLSDIAKRRNEIEPGFVSEEKITNFYELENQSRRVVIVNGDKELIFYLSYIKDRWVLTIIDKATGDCSV